MSLSLSSRTSTEMVSVDLTWNEIGNSSLRPSPFGLNSSGPLTCWRTVGVCLSRWATKNAANVAATSSAKTTRAAVVTAPPAIRWGRRPSSAAGPGSAPARAGWRCGERRPAPGAGRGHGCRLAPRPRAPAGRRTTRRRGTRSRSRRPGTRRTTRAPPPRPRRTAGPSSRRRRSPSAAAPRRSPARAAAPRSPRSPARAAAGCSTARRCRATPPPRPARAPARARARTARPAPGPGSGARRCRPSRRGARARSRGEVDRVRAQPQPQRLEAQHVVGRDVAEVGVWPEAPQQPDLLVLLRRLEDDAGDVDRVRDLVDEAHPHLAVGAVDAGGAGLARLGDHLPRARLELGLHLLDPDVGGLVLVVVLGADLGEDEESLAGKAPDQLALRGRLQGDRPVADLDALDAQRPQPRDQLLDALLADGQLGERAAQHDRDLVVAVARELGLEVLRGQRRPPAELDDVDERA